MLILLSPSKTQDFESDIKPVNATDPRFLSDSTALIKALKPYSQEKLSALMGISPALAKLNYDRYRRFHTPFTDDNARPAIFAFQGDVYDGLQAESLNAKELAFAQTHLRILSGLYGVLRPLDRIQPYRLEMSIRLPTKHGKNLYTFWGDRLSKSLHKELSGHKDQVIVNLASEEYAKAARLPAFEAVITPQFKEKRGKEVKMIALFAKQARGRMARYLIEQGNKALERLTGFAENGYIYEKSLSSELRPVFVRGAG